MKMASYGYRGRQIAPGRRDSLTSTYVGLPLGIVRSAAELAALLRGEKFSYLRAPNDEDERDRLRALLVAAMKG